MKNTKDVPDGIIQLDSDFATYYGFTSEFFYKETFLLGNSSQRQVTIPMLISNFPGEGHFSKGVKKLTQDGIRVFIQTPVPKMQEILSAWGFEIVWDDKERVEYWVSPTE
jgi:hypothetical protein